MGQSGAEDPGICLGRDVILLSEYTEYPLLNSELLFLYLGFEQIKHTRYKVFINKF